MSFLHNRLGRRISDQSVRAMLRKRATLSGLTLPLTPDFLHSKWSLVNGDMPAGSHELWPLEANLDSAVVAAYAYDLYPKGVVMPYMPTPK